MIPFKHGKIIDEKYFVNRTQEIARVSTLLASKINVTLLSPRRWGKSSLMKKVAEKMEKENKQIRFVFIDFFKTRDEKEFYELFATEVLKASYSKWEERITAAKVIFKQIIPKFQIGLDPANDFQVGLDWEEIEKNPDEILELPERISIHKGLQLIICLDEFQNIVHFNDSLGFQKKLRATWQHHDHCSYAIYGSKQHMMTAIFEDKSMPFYKFGELLFLSKIANDHWKKYIVAQFKKTGKKMSTTVAGKLADAVKNHPYFVQQLAASTWISTVDVCTDETLNEAIDQLILQYELVFSKEVDGVSNLQLNLLKAIIKGEKQLSSKSTIKKYKLSSSATVNRSKEALVQKEIIDTFRGSIEFLDPLFELWLKRYYFN